MTRMNIWDDTIGNRVAVIAAINNLAATADPGATDDSSKGYEPGSIWLHGSNIFICTSATAGAAVWEQLASEANFVVGAATESQPANPTAPASTSVFKMQGLAGAITPVRSGKIQVTIRGNLIGSTTTAGDGIIIQGSYGIGAAPANAGNLAGTQQGAVQEYTNPATVTAADVNIPFSLTFLITGATLNTALWLDLAAKSVATASAIGLANVDITAVEL